MRRFVPITILVSLSVSAQEIVFEDGFENLPPVIITEPATIARVDELYLYDVNALDPGGDTLLYLLTTSPAGMVMGPTSGIISWTPSAAGQFPVEIDVSNTGQQSATQSWVITVEEAADTDGDGLSNVRESWYGTDPDDPDSDDDGLNDGDEVFIHGTDPRDSDTDFDGLGDGAEVDTHATDPLDVDTDGDLFGDGVEITAGTDPLDPDDFPAGPPDPAAVAPPVDPSVAANLYDTAEFLWNGTPPIQTGVTEGTIDPVRAAVLRGYVMDRAGLPLPGAVVTINNHPEYGQTISRADGRFDLVVNGGGPLTVDFNRTDYLPAQRRVQVGWRSWHSVPDIALIPLDGQVTGVDLNLAVDMQVAQGSPVTDTDGTRQATVLFPQGTTAMMRMPDDTLVPISDLSVRATEYTVGDNGPAAMPGELPPDSAYTYAVELSVDEAMQAGAEAVEFDNPIPFYVDNFLGFPAGTAVPSGFYDRGAGRWVASENGLVIDVLDEVGGLATLDLDGSGTPADPSELSAAGIVDAEREQLANLYDPGDSIWRVPIAHFSSWDSNWGFSPPNDATPPNQPAPRSYRPEENGTCPVTGNSYVVCQNQDLGERVAVAGTPFFLSYLSSRTAGNVAKNSISVSLSGGSVPASLLGIGLEVTVAGQTHHYDFPPDANQALDFVWNGKDPYGRKLNGAQPFLARISYNYQGVYGETERFGYRGNGTVIEGSKSRGILALPEEHQAFVGSLDAKGNHLGAWSLSHHHSYDVNRSILYLGDGTQRSAEAIAPVISTSAGTGSKGFSGDGGPANEARLDRVYGVATGPDGTVYIADLENHRVRHVDHNGIITTYAGTGSPGWNGDNIPATSANVTWPRGLAFGPDGSLYIAEDGGERIRRVDADGIITTVAGTGVTGFSGDGGPATEARISGPEKIAFGPDGDLYIADSENERVRRVDAAGIISTVAGNGSQGYNGDGIPAVAAELSDPSGVAIDDSGNLYISDSTNYRIRKVGPDGIISTFAGTGVQGFNGDGQLATNTQLGQPAGIRFDSAGILYIADDHNQRIRAVTPDGILTSVAGSGPTGQDNYESSGDGGLATAGRLTRPEDVVVGPDGRMHIAEFIGYRVRTVERAMPGFNATDLLVPSSDGDELYRFDAAGRHLQTLHSLTGAVLYQFDYDLNGRLGTVTDGDGNVTSIQRDGLGSPTTIIGPFGRVTELGIDTNGFLEAITDPAGENLHFQSTTHGLIALALDAGKTPSAYTFDSLGRLTQVKDAVGGVQSWARTDVERGFEVAHTKASGEVTTFRIERNQEQERILTQTFPDTTSSQAIYRPDGSREVTLPDGMQLSATYGPDPRFGMQSPVATSRATITPLGLDATTTIDREVQLAEPDDPLSIESLTETITRNGRTTTVGYDGSTRRITVSSPVGRQMTVELDAQGRALVSQISMLEPLANEYDELGQLTAIVEGAGLNARTTTVSYDGLGEIASIEDPVGRITGFDYDAAGRVINYTLPDGESLGYSFDSIGNPLSVTPPQRPAHTFNYSANGRREGYAAPQVGTEAHTTQYAYDLGGRATEIHYPDGTTTTLAYDLHGRLSTITIPRGVYTSTYDVQSGHLTGLTDPAGGSLGYGFDGALTASESWGGDINGTLERNFDSSLAVESFSINGGPPISIGYDEDGLLISAGGLEITRDASSGLISGTALGMVTDVWNHDDFGDRSGYEAAFGGVPIISWNYSRDAVGRIIDLDETVNGITTSTEYQYDVIGRLEEVVRDGMTIASYTYDAVGNRLQRTGSDTVLGIYDDQDRLVQYGALGYGYSVKGDLQTKVESGPEDVTKYEYDALGNLVNVELPDGTLIGYVIDGRNRRVGRRLDGVLVQAFLYYGQGNVIAELDSVGNVVSEFVYGTRLNVPDYMIRGAQIYRIISDYQGSPRRVVDVTTGNVAQALEFDEFGNVLMDTNPGFQPFGFAGGLYDPATGLIRYGARDYDPVTGRWLSKDSTRFGGRDANFYAYALGDPINLIDRTGHAPGEPFSTPAEALVDALKYAFCASSLHPQVQRDVAPSGKVYEATVPREFGGFIYAKDGKYFSSPLQPGRDNKSSVNLEVPMSCSIYQPLATFHTHPFSKRYSDADLYLAKKRNIPSYVVAPDGDVLLYDPSAGVLDEKINGSFNEGPLNADCDVAGFSPDPYIEW